MQRIFRYWCTVWLLCGSPVLSANVFSELEREVQGSHESIIEENDKAFAAFRRDADVAFVDYKKKIASEFDTFKKISEEEISAFKQRITGVWDNPEISSNTVWVEYSHDLRLKRRVDFGQGKISFSIIGASREQDLRRSVKALLTKNKAEAFRDDAISQAIEQRSVKHIAGVKTDRVKPAPILVPYLTGKNAVASNDVERIVDHMLANQTTRKTTSKRGEKIVTVTMPLQAPANVVKKRPVNDRLQQSLAKKSLPVSAQSLQASVVKYSTKASVPQALVFAVIETESSFNPMARSAVPAYGLMQIVPRSAGQDATAQLFGKPKILSPSYLYNSDNNIEIGATYLNILNYRYLKKITDPESRRYCVIAAYNTGAGNVAKAFTGNTRISEAVVKINRMSPREVYDHLIHHLPYDETRHYLKRVNKRIAKYH